MCPCRAHAEVAAAKPCTLEKALQFRQRCSLRERGTHTRRHVGAANALLPPTPAEEQ